MTNIERVTKAGRAMYEAGYERGKAMKPNPDGVYENGRADGKREVIKFFEDEGFIITQDGISHVDRDEFGDPIRVTHRNRDRESYHKAVQALQKG